MKKNLVNVLKKSPINDFYQFRIEINKIGSLPLKIIRILEELWNVEREIKSMEKEIEYYKVQIEKLGIEIDLAEKELEKKEKRILKEMLEKDCEDLEIQISRFKVYFKILKKYWNEVEDKIKKKTGKTIKEIFKNIDWFEEGKVSFIFQKACEIAASETFGKEELGFLPPTDMQSVVKDLKRFYPEFKDILSKEIYNEEE